MNTVEKINVILKEANISKVNLAKYLGVSRQMVYNYLDGEDLSKLSNDKSQALFALLSVKNEEELKDYFVIPHDVRVVEIKAKQLKAGVAND